MNPLRAGDGEIIVCWPSAHDFAGFRITDDQFVEEQRLRVIRAVGLESLGEGAERHRARAVVGGAFAVSHGPVIVGFAKKV
jgi:hypothetical protein